MPCHLHLLGTGCESGFFCTSAFQDPDGVHLIHGNNNRFMHGKTFYPLFNLYQQVKYNLNVETLPVLTTISSNKVCCPSTV